MIINDLYIPDTVDHIIFHPYGSPENPIGPPALNVPNVPKVPKVQRAGATGTRWRSASHGKRR